MSAESPKHDSSSRASWLSSCRNSVQLVEQVPPNVLRRSLVTVKLKLVRSGRYFHRRFVSAASAERSDGTRTLQ